MVVVVVVIFTIYKENIKKRMRTDCEKKKIFFYSISFSIFFKYDVIIQLIVNVYVKI